MSKFRELKIRFKVWWENAEGGMRVLTVGFFVVTVLLILGGAAYGVISYFQWKQGKIASPLAPEGSSGESLEEVIRPSGKGEKTVPTPVNGVLYTEEEAELFLNRRPLAIMINNHSAARPQFGLSKADLVYEAVAEGGITRFLALFHAWDVNKIGPVRSARIYYEDWAAEFNAWYAHWGGAYMDADDKANQDNPNYNFTCNPAADAYAKINRISLPSLDQMWLGDTAYWRENNRGVATEHTGYTSTMKLWEEAPNKYPGWEGYTVFKTWKFKEDDPVQVAGEGSPSSAEAPTDAEAMVGKTEGRPAQLPSRSVGTGEAPPVSTIKFNFWDIPAFEVKWEYVPEENLYKRYQGGEVQVDAGADNVPLKAKNVILQFTKESAFGDQKKHLNYQTVGSGEAKIFMDGKEIDATWKKPEIRERTRFYDAAGREIKFNRGQIWIEVVPAQNIENVEIG